ncbi:TlpA family protein disulfide reductase [Micrococcoides hystricis]|uniref:TlpA family protein disulfide reductase n=1 Tax=Micrococcoides hystricis TaxID=1572761 RepID=A0ABV6PDW6_9MICC
MRSFFSSAPLNRRGFLAAAAAGSMAFLAACTEKSDLAKQAEAGGSKNYIAGDGSVEEYAPENRKDPVTFSSELFDGTTVTEQDILGSVTVMNFWYAACAPCRIEAPHLSELHAEYKDKGVEFYGVNVRDTVGTAVAFERNFKIEYPSFEDRTAKMLLAMTDYVPPQAVPTTLVFDKEGRVSARILGVVEKSTLKALIESVL